MPSSTTIHTLPDELLDHIILSTDRRSLWSLITTCARFRRVGILPYLSLFGISQTAIDSGVIPLTDSFAPVVVVSHIRPIQRLVCFERGPAGQPGSGLSIRKLVRLLQSVPPIPDIVFYNRYSLAQKTRSEALQLLAGIPSVTQNPLLLVSPQQWILSRPRKARPIEWKLLPPPFNRNSRRISTSMKFLIVIFGIPLLFAYLVSALTNAVVLLVWLYEFFWGKPWSFEDRIRHDFGTISFSYWMRVQVLPEVTLLTLADKHSPELVLRAAKELKPEQFTAVVKALAFGPHLRSLHVGPEVRLVYNDLVEFISRHPGLEATAFYRESILASSLPLGPLPDPVTHVPSRILRLHAPLAYMPHLLPLAPTVKNIMFTHTILTSAKLRTATFDASAYLASLEALVALPGTEPLHLALVLRATSGCLPWTTLVGATPDHDPDPEAAVGLPAAPTPTHPGPLLETRHKLSRITELTLYNDGAALLRASHLLEGNPNNAFARWLGLFPGLQSVTFAPGVIWSDWVGDAQREAVEGAVAGIASGIGITWNVKTSGSLW
ncbi:hypothetical protein HMN09_00465200 [Mycena chlorophos]|uniref:F-box domain-containing protein n=1 Tax=Mycena chlorophos TaxID=658473 RepID=A0A8H6WGZ3_MYCCL|nr:hypothetical protein HMN09_00465200 [Mycena chlorophos]